LNPTLTFTPPPTEPKVIVYVVIGIGLLAAAYVG